MRHMQFIVLGLLGSTIVGACSGSISGSNREAPGSAGNQSGGQAGGDGSGGSVGTGGSAGAGDFVDSIIPPTSVACANDKPSSGPASWRRLTTTQYRNTIKDLLGIEADTTLFLSDGATGRFSTNARIATPDAQILKYQDTAGKLALGAVRDLPKLTGCAAAEAEDACASRFVNDFGARAWRRPLTDTDRTLLDTVYRVGKQTSFANGVRLVVEAILQSPSFMYLVEVGGVTTDGVAALDPYELASRLSYVLWDSMPDAELTKAARDGVLKQSDGLRKQAERLMSSPRFSPTLFSFHEQLLRLNSLVKPGGVVRDPKRYTVWNDVLKTAMRDEARSFVTSVFSQGEGTVKELLTAPYGFPSGPLVTLYGGQTPDATGRVTFTDGTRRGILTQAGTLSAAVPLDSPLRAILRGKQLREQIFCEALPDVPGDVMFKPRPGADMMTQQQLLRAHQEDATCKACHEQMDPLGFAFENYDGIGRYRTTAEDGNPVDTSGSVVGTDVGGDFSDTAGLIDKLAMSTQVRGCFTQQWFRFTSGREATDADACSLARARDVLVEADGDVRKALTLMVSSDSFRYRGGL